MASQKKTENKVILLSDDSLAEDDSSISRKEKLSAKSSFVMSESPFDEAKTMIKIVLLIAMSIIFELGPQIIGSMMIGHFYDSASKDDEFLSAVGLSWTYVYITGIAVTWGLTTGLFTLVPQALGKEDPDAANALLAVYTQRAFFVVTLACIPLLILQFFAGKLMTAIGEPEKLEPQIQNFTYTVIPYIMGQAYFSILLRVNQAMELNVFVTVLTGLAFAISWPAMYILMTSAGLGYLGTGIAQSIIMWCMFFILIGKMIREGYGFVFRPASFYAVTNWNAVKEYLSLSMPGMVQNGFEFIVIQMAVILSGYVGNKRQRTTAIAASVIMYELFYIAVALGYGLGNAVNIRVGKYIGRGNIEYAKSSFKVGFWLSIAVCLLFIIILCAGNQAIPLIFTHNPDVDALASKLCPAFAFFTTFFLQSQLWGGIYRGLGYQRKSAIFVAVGYYVLCLPLLFVLLFAAGWRRDLELGTMTVWLGLGSGNLFAVVMCVIYFYYRVDWENALDESVQRMKRTLTEVGSKSDIENDHAIPDVDL